MEVRKGTQISEEKEVSGSEIKFKIVKNKLAAPYKTAQTDLLFNEGIDQNSELVDIGLRIRNFW
ncbi:DNA recombination/repair protein RecA [Mycoplasmopsis cynos]|nr:DNA recombination/repair protein RecA [Mycoplasmopsis cynos]